MLLVNTKQDKERLWIEYRERLDRFKKELTGLINRHSLDTFVSTPDYVLADYLTSCLVEFRDAVFARDASCTERLSVSQHRISKKAKKSKIKQK